MRQKKAPDKVIPHQQLSLWGDGDLEQVIQDYVAARPDAAPTGAGDQPAQAAAPRRPPYGKPAGPPPQSVAVPPQEVLRKAPIGVFDNTQTQQEYAGKIVQVLARICASGYRPDQVYSDWVELVLACFTMLPAHLASAVRHGRLAEDTPEVKQLFERLRARYPRRHFELFAQATGLLLASTEFGYMDVLGQVFEWFCQPSPRLGQYATPLIIAGFMASAVLMGGEREVHERLKQAIDESPLAQAALLAGLMFKEEEGDQAFEWFVTRVVPPALPFYKPITVYDPCVGTGRLLLAAAATYPPWMVRLGLVQFFGSDIDQMMVNVARSNMLLYGLNGSSLRYAQALAPSEPEALARAYRLEDGPARAVQSVQRVDETPADIQSVQVDIFDWSGAENSPPAPPPLDGKVCAGCRAAPQDKPGTWYLFDNAAFCPACASSAQATAGEGRVIEVRYG